MTIKELALNLLLIIAVMGTIITLSSLNMLAFWMILLLSIGLWITYTILVIRDHSRDIKYPILRYREKPKVPIPMKVRKKIDYDTE